MSLFQMPLSAVPYNSPCSKTLNISAELPLPEMSPQSLQVPVASLTAQPCAACPVPTAWVTPSLDGALTGLTTAFLPQSEHKYVFLSLAPRSPK